MTDWDIDDGSESVSEENREIVFDRDGRQCWFCHSVAEPSLEIAHHIDAAAGSHFALYRQDGTIPEHVTDPSHPDNLIPLCSNCHRSYSAAFPGWMPIPDAKTIQTLIDHELADYESRLKTFLPRTLPILDRTRIYYHPCLVSPQFERGLNHMPCNSMPRWPKPWLGEPTTVLHRVARRGLLESTPGRAIHLGRGPHRFRWMTGVPLNLQSLAVNLVRLWARPVPQAGKRA